MKVKTIIVGIIIAGFIIFGAYSFLQSNVEYTNFQQAKATGKKVQVAGAWIQDRGSYFDPRTNQFVFYMHDDQNNIAKVMLDGAKPNNFEIATSIVVKGRYRDGVFHASEVLTKCPSKYEGKGSEVQKTM